MTKVLPKDAVERLLDEALAYLRAENTLKRNLTTLAQPIAKSVKVPQSDSTYTDMVRRMGEKPAAKFLAEMTPMDAALWEHFQATSLLKEKIRRWQTRRHMEERSVLTHERTLDALRAWQHAVRQAHIEQSQKAVLEKIRVAAEEAHEQSRTIMASNRKVLEQRAAQAYKSNIAFDERLDGVRARAANIALFRQWLEDVQRAANEDKLLDRNEKLQVKLQELNLLVAAHESALAYGTKPHVIPGPRLGLDTGPTYRLQALNPYKRGA